MGEIAYNLVSIKGSPELIDQFFKKAYLREGEEFCFTKLLPVPKNIKEPGGAIRGSVEYYWRLKNYGNWWGSGFSLLVEKDKNSLKYYFNSREYSANLDSICKKFPGLVFTQLSIEWDMDGEIIKFIIYPSAQNKERRICQSETNGPFNWEIYSDPRTLIYIEELYYKHLMLFRHFPKVWQGNEAFLSGSDFYEYFPQEKFLQSNSRFYNGLIRKENHFSSKDLSFARSMRGYYRENSPLYKMMFLHNSFLTEMKAQQYLNKIIRAVRKNKMLLSVEECAALAYASECLGAKQKVDKFIKSCIVAETNWVKKTILRAEEISCLIPDSIFAVVFYKRDGVVDDFDSNLKGKGFPQIIKEYHLSIDNLLKKVMPKEKLTEETFLKPALEIINAKGPFNEKKQERLNVILDSKLKDIEKMRKKIKSLNVKLKDMPVFISDVPCDYLCESINNLRVVKMADTRGSNDLPF